MAPLGLKAIVGERESFSLAPRASFASFRPHHTFQAQPFIRRAKARAHPSTDCQHVTVEAKVLRRDVEER